jgi:YQGE family putative transporter
MLVLSLAGSEATLGLVQTAGGLLAALLLYGLGRLAAPRHRIAVFAAGLALFAIGAAFNAALFNAAGALLFVVSLLLAKPLLDLAYFPIQLSVIDTLSTLEQRPRFAYILSHEFGQYLGRVLGCGLFLVLARLISAVFALRFAMLAVALLQLLSIRLAHTTIAGARSAQVEAEACAAGAGGESSQYFQVSLDSKGEC